MFQRIVQIVALCGILTYGAVARAQEQVVVKPEETDEILANPGMGWETFHQTSKQDKSLPKWIPSTIQYARWGWGELEPQPGKLNTEFLDKVLKETHDSGQKLAFRVMCCSTTLNAPYHPKWLKNRRQGTAGRLPGARPVPDTRYGRSRRLEGPSRFHQAVGREVRRPPRHRPHRPWLHRLVG